MPPHPYIKSSQPITVMGFPLGPVAPPPAKKDFLPNSNLPSFPPASSSSSSSRELRFNLNGAVVALALIALLSLMNDDEKRQSEDLILLQQLQLVLKVIPPSLALGALLCALCVVLALFVFTMVTTTAAATAAASAKRPSSDGRFQALKAVVCARSLEGEEESRAGLC
ncbi:hypothetical protein BASA81_000171 [Batrachochytrium salamandrivorans]|nr:hypothetical protein BASA81_000171 [Batrachochytrium salamandrivorans]